MNGHSDHGGIGLGLVASPSSTGIKVIIVGSGFAGLACAIECKRKGHDVLVLEKFSELKVLGDVISLGPNAGRFIERWGLHDKFWPICAHAPFLNLHNYLGEVIHVQPLPEHEYGSQSYNGHRGEMHQILFEHAESIGVDIRVGQNVTEYWENVQDGVAAVISNGECIHGDVVIGADGVRSKARELILGFNDKPRSSGYAIYRAWFTAQENGVDKDPLTNFLTTGNDVLYGWIGQDVHLLASCFQNSTAISWLMTHRDDADINESWSFRGKTSDVLALVKGWDPRCAALLSKAPWCVDWKLVYRDPLPTWISEGARMAVIGDAAHPFLPTSMQGASQAIEDGVVLAVALQLAGKANIPLALRAWESIRYQRVRTAQIMGETTRDKWHQASPGDRGECMDIPRPEWLLSFDAEAHAYQVYDNVVKQIKDHGYKHPTCP